MRHYFYYPTVLFLAAVIQLCTSINCHAQLLDHIEHIESTSRSEEEIRTQTALAIIQSIKDDDDLMTSPTVKSFIDGITAGIAIADPIEPEAKFDGKVIGELVGSVNGFLISPDIKFDGAWDDKSGFRFGFRAIGVDLTTDTSRLVNATSILIPEKSIFATKAYAMWIPCFSKKKFSVSIGVFGALKKVTSTERYTPSDNATGVDAIDSVIERTHNLHVLMPQFQIEFSPLSQWVMYAGLTGIAVGDGSSELKQYFGANRTTFGTVDFGFAGRPAKSYELGLGISFIDTDLRQIRGEESPFVLKFYAAFLKEAD